MAFVAPVIEETAPVLIRSLLIPFAVLAGYFLAWGIAFSIDAFCRGLFGTINGVVGWIPYANRVVETPLHGIEKKILSFLGGLEAHFEHQMATRFHQLAQLIDWQAVTPVNAAIVEWNIARRLYRLYQEIRSGQLQAHITAWVKQQLAHLQGVQTVVIHKTTVIEKTIVGKSKAGAITVTKPIAAELDHVIEIDLPRIKARERATQDELTRLWKWAHRRAVPIATGAALGALVYALGKLGIGWVRCSAVKSAGKRVCGMDRNLLDSLLADTLLIAGTLSLVEFAEEMRGVTETAVRPISTFWRAS